MKLGRAAARRVCSERAVRGAAAGQGPACPNFVIEWGWMTVVFWRGYLRGQRMGMAKPHRLRRFPTAPQVFATIARTLMYCIVSSSAPVVVGTFCTCTEPTRYYTELVIFSRARMPYISGCTVHVRSMYIRCVRPSLCSSPFQRTHIPARLSLIAHRFFRISWFFRIFPER